MFNSAFDRITGNTLDFWPEALRPEIEAVNAGSTPGINNGVYRAGFARTQAAYDEAAARGLRDARLDRGPARRAGAS